MAKKIRSITTDPRYPELLELFSSDWSYAMEVFFGIYPSDQQEDIIEKVNAQSSRVSVRSGHGTGKSLNAAAMILLFMIFFPNSRVVVIAAKISVVRDAIWSNMFKLFDELKKRKPWVAKYYELTDTTFYEKSRKLLWRVDCKGYRINNEQTLAGEHRDFMLTILDEASVITDAAVKTVLGAQTSKDNRVLMMSQPTHSGGFFYETHNSLCKENGGSWDSIVLRSDESEWVEPAFIENALQDYGGYDSPEFKIKVLGEFPDKMAEFLLGREETQAAVGRVIELPEDDWGWVAACDVGVTRDRSVINISKVSGPIGSQRKVQNYQLLQMPPDVTPIIFARKIVAMCCNGAYPNITIAIDADGIGFSVWEYVCELVEEQGYDDVTVLAIRWGKPPFSNQQRKRFKNLRAMAHFFAGEAIRDGRMSLDKDPSTVDQFSKLPCTINGEGQYVMMPKLEMKRKYQLKSPDRSDTYCFLMIVPYKEAVIETTFFDDIEDEFSNWLGADMPELENDITQDDENWEHHNVDDEEDEDPKDYNDWFNSDGTVEGFDELGNPLDVK